MVDSYHQLESIFHPRSIAFVGITTSNPFHWTRTFWNSVRAFNFNGPLYPVNPSGGELDGCRVYTSLDEVPAYKGLVAAASLSVMALALFLWGFFA